MEHEQWQKKEFECLRNELNGRILFLHQSISLAAVVLSVLVLAGFGFVAFGVSREFIDTYALAIPILVSFIGFNYQSNQNSLEIIPKYFDEEVRPSLIQKYGEQKLLGWERYFAVMKKPFRFESVTKVFPFVSPFLIPLYYIFTDSLLLDYQWVLVGINIFLLILMLENFRYKLRRVK